MRCAGAAGLRPSPDAVRETLFNWLPHDLCGKTCLDLFAGSGAFGFEAASRGAEKVVMVESNRQAIDLLHDNRRQLNADEVEIVEGTVEKFIQTTRNNDFDILFLDPPFGGGVIEATCENLHERGFVKRAGLVYIESARDDPLPIPRAWRIIRQSRCGMVQSTLIQT